VPEAPLDAHLNIGAIIYPMMDQIDFTGPFEVLSRIPGSTFHVIGKDHTPVRDIRGLLLTPEETFSQAPQLDLLLVPGGWGQEALMDDELVLSFIRKQAAGAKILMSVCTGALICGAAGLLKGRRAPRIGPCIICWATSARSRWPRGWWWTAIWLPPRALPPGSTARCEWYQCCAAMTPPKRFNLSSSTRPSPVQQRHFRHRPQAHP